METMNLLMGRPNEVDYRALAEHLNTARPTSPKPPPTTQPSAILLLLPQPLNEALLLSTSAIGYWTLTRLKDPRRITLELKRAATDARLNDKRSRRRFE
jgi:hypothetical protein